MFRLHPHFPPRLPIVVLALCGALFAAPPAAAKLQVYALDPVHTQVGFQVSHAGLSNSLGSFSGSQGSLAFDPQDWTSARLSVRIPIQGLHLGDARWQQRTLDRTFFDAADFPEATFVSTLVEPTGPTSANVVGDLTLRGVTRPVTLAVTLNAMKRHPLTRRHTIGFSATGTLSRSAFGIDAWKSLVGDEVRLIIEVEAMRDKEAEEDAAP